MKSGIPSKLGQYRILEVSALFLAVLGCWILFASQVERSKIASPRTFEMGLIYWPPSEGTFTEDLIKMGVGFTLEKSEHIVVQIPFSPHSAPPYETAKWMSGIARDHDRNLTIAYDWMTEDRNELLDNLSVPWSFGTTEVQGLFLRSVSELASTFKPQFFLLGVEVDFLARSDPQEFRNFVRVYEQAHRRIREASPLTKVTVSFQFEYLREMVERGESVSDSPIVVAFGPLLDILGLSVYPCQITTHPDTLPLDYFSSVIPFGLPVAVFETGWPTLQNESTQAAYLNWILGVSTTTNLSLLVWASVLDTKRGSILEEEVNEPPCSRPVSEWNGAIGLWQSDGTQKASMSNWQNWLNSPRSVRAGEAAIMAPKDPTKPRY